LVEIRVENLKIFENYTFWDKRVPIRYIYISSTVLPYTPLKTPPQSGIAYSRHFSPTETVGLLQFLIQFTDEDGKNSQRLQGCEGHKTTKPVELSLSFLHRLIEAVLSCI